MKKGKTHFLFPTSMLRRRMISIPLLTPYESQLLSLLKDCAHWIDTTNQLSALPNLPDALPSALEYKATQDSLHPRDKVVLRVAGGWVRDKLLQKPSDDIDISTSPYPLTGFAFAQLLHQYCHTILLQPELVSPSIPRNEQPELTPISSS